jgi:hypothetical protein
MSESQSERAVESDYLRGYLQGTLDALNTNDAPSHVEPWDCATVSLAEWLRGNGTFKFNSQTRK